jgi:hypothetical protein
MKRAATLNRYFILALALTLLLALGAAIVAWAATLEQRGAMLRESRFQYSLNNVRSALESGLQLGLLLPDLPNAQELIEQNRAQKSVILSIDVFDPNGHIVFTTDNGGVGAAIPRAWLAPCLNLDHARDRDNPNWSSQDDEGRLLCGPLINGYEQTAGGVVLRYRLSDRASTLGLLANYWTAALGLLLVLGAVGSLAGWLILRRIETRLAHQTDAIGGIHAARNDTLTGPLATGLATLEKLEHELATADREADRLDNLN